MYKRRSDGIHVINLEKTYEKLQLAARIIVAIENPQVCSLDPIASIAFIHRSIVLSISWRPRLSALPLFP